MISKVFENLYCLKIPLPDSPLLAVNVYVIYAPPRSLIVDTGLDRDICENAFHKCLSDLNLEMEDCDLFISHFHADHAGLLPKLDLIRSTVYMSRTDAGNYADARYWETLGDTALINGFPEDKIREAVTSHPGYKYRNPVSIDFTALSEGDCLSVGGYVFTCFETPGHTSGHLCLYESNHCLLLAGDLILDRITPVVQSWCLEDNPLDAYLKSLDKIKDLNIAYLLPGHGPVISRIKPRIDEIRTHHLERCNEILSVLTDSPMNACEIASNLSWHTAWRHWKNFPRWQQLLALGETLAHLNHLFSRNLVWRECVDRRIYFRSQSGTRTPSSSRGK